jgi:nicotinamidase/pyrazinamidase
MNNFPDFYNPQRVGALFYPDVARIADHAQKNSLPPAAQDAQKVHLVIIDMQVDFCHVGGSLYVPGAGDDIRRLIEFIYRHAGRISQITCSLDSHLPHQIFHPAWWADGAGNHPAPFTMITYDEVIAGKWQPLQERERSIQYLKKLEAEAKKTLTIWPYHVMIGGIGNALDPELFSAVLWHSLARQSQPHWLTKGSIPLTEHYSIIQPEVPMADQPMGSKNQAFLDALAEADAMIIAGEAASHCVLETMEDLLEEFGEQPEVLQRIYFLSDCTSPVVHPEVDFQAITQARFAEFAAQGVNFIQSTDPLPF